MPETVHTAGVSDRNEIAGPGSGAEARDLTLGEVFRVTEAVRGTCSPTLVWGCPGWVPAGWGKETSCCCCPVPIWKARARSGAAANWVFPACEAVIVHTPAATVVTIVPETVHTSGVAERNETGSPDDALACRVTGVPTGVSAAPADVPSGCLNLMACRAAPAAVPASARVAVSRACPARAGRPGAGGSGPAAWPDPPSPRPGRGPGACTSSPEPGLTRPDPARLQAPRPVHHDRTPLSSRDAPLGVTSLWIERCGGGRGYLPGGESSLASAVPGQRPGSAGAFHVSTTGWPCSVPSVDSVPVSSRSSRP